MMSGRSLVFLLHSTAYHKIAEPHEPQIVTRPASIEKYQQELSALADNIPFRQIEDLIFDDPSFTPDSVRQERTFARVESGMQAISRFLVERGTVDLLNSEQVTNLFEEIHWCIHHIDMFVKKEVTDPKDARGLVMEARAMISRIEAAEEELFIANRRLVVRCVKPFFWIGQVWLGDFLQEGSKALSNAIRKFNFTRGTPFYAYAQKAIQNRLRNYFRDHVRSGSIGIRPTRDMLKVKSATEAWVKIHGDEPDVETLAKMTELPKSKVTQLRSFIQQYENVPTPPVSLDALAGDTMANLHDLIEDLDAKVASEVAQVGEIWQAVDQLPERSRYIMKLRFIEGRTLEETGQLLNLTRARIKQIQDDSLRKLRALLAEGLYRK